MHCGVDLQLTFLVGQQVVQILRHQEAVAFGELGQLDAFATLGLELALGGPITQT